MVHNRVAPNLLMLVLLAIVLKNGCSFVARYAAARFGLATMRDDLSEYRAPASHRIGAALAAAKMLDLDKDQTYR